MAFCLKVAQLFGLPGRFRWGKSPPGSNRAQTPPVFRDPLCGGCPRNAPVERHWSPGPGRKRPVPGLQLNTWATGRDAPAPLPIRDGLSPPWTSQARQPAKGGAQVAKGPPLQRQPRTDRVTGGQSRVVFRSTGGTFAAPGGAAGQRRAVERENRKGCAV